MKDNVKIELTEDGSATLFSERVNEHYHSIHGAVQESVHVFIKAGLQYILPKKHSINILEVGFGTGLNALLTLKEYLEFQNSHTQKTWHDKIDQTLDSNLSNQEKSINYTALEPYPIQESLVHDLKYSDYLSIPSLSDSFKSMHIEPSGKVINLTGKFNFNKLELKLQNYKPEDRLYDLVYFDAFSPAVEPELWTPEVFQHLYNIINEESALVTYCSKGVVRRMMQECGFKVERLPGPPGKHEMLRAVK